MARTFWIVAMPVWMALEILPMMSPTTAAAPLSKPSEASKAVTPPPTPPIRTPAVTFWSRAKAPLIVSMAALTACPILSPAALICARTCGSCRALTSSERGFLSAANVPPLKVRSATSLRSWREAIRPLKVLAWRAPAPAFCSIICVMASIACPAGIRPSCCIFWSSCVDFPVICESLSNTCPMPIPACDSCRSSPPIRTPRAWIWPIARATRSIVAPLTPLAAAKSSWAAVRRCACSEVKPKAIAIRNAPATSSWENGDWTASCCIQLMSSWARPPACSIAAPRLAADPLATISRATMLSRDMVRRS